MEENLKQRKMQTIDEGKTSRKIKKYSSKEVHKIKR